LPRFKLGRNRPSVSERRLRFAHYLTDAPISPPPTVSHWSETQTESGGYACLTNVMGNDTLGNCTCAGAAHIEGILRANAGNVDRLPITGDAIAFYSLSCGYLPGDPSTDQGGDEVTVLNCWKNKGFFPDGSGKIAAWVTLDAANVEQVRRAIWLFENCYFGVELPDGWLGDHEPQRNGFTWDVVGDANPANGHCFVGVGYNENGVIIDTWGLIGTVTWAAVAKYATSTSQGELYAVVSEDAINRTKRKAPNSFDFDELIADSGSL
jgi:hypothetical protein